jgi:hypothetical protein
MRNMLDCFRSRVCYTVALILIFSIYFIINRAVPPKVEPISYLDTLIPFMPHWGIPYVSYLLLVSGSVAYSFVFSKFDKHKLFVVSLMAVQMIAYAAYLIVPGKITRPTTLGESFSDDVVRTIYALDTPNSTNRFNAY